MRQTFKDLKVYQISYTLAKEIESLTNLLPKSELFRYSDQILRSSRAIVANIAEGFGRKKMKRDFIKFLTYALSSSDETQTHLKLIYASGLTKKETYLALIRQYKNLSVRLVNFITSIKQNDLKEGPSEVNTKSIRVIVAE